MAINETQAAEELQQANNVSPHRLISLLMAGTLERIAQAKDSMAAGRDEESELLLGKVTAIINGLRESLDFSSGGEIAVNLDALYGYMLNQFEQANETGKQDEVLDEVGRLMQEVKSGWDAIADQKAA